MTKTCFVCEKSVVTGGNRKHRRGSSGGGGAWRFKSQRTLRKWRPNLRPITINEDGNVFREVICMKCYKRLKKDEKDDLVSVSVPATKTNSTSVSK